MSAPQYAYTAEQRAFAKTLVVAHGSIAAAQRHMQALWYDAATDAPLDGDELPFGIPPPPPQVPGERTLKAWRDNATITVDQPLVEQFAQHARQWVTGSALRIAEAAEEALTAAIEADDYKAAGAYSGIWSQATERLAPKNAPQASPFALPGGIPVGARFSLTYQVEAPRAIAEAQLA